MTIFVVFQFDPRCVFIQSFYSQSCQRQYRIVSSSEWPFNSGQFDQQKRMSLQVIVNSLNRESRPHPTAGSFLIRGEWSEL